MRIWIAFFFLIIFLVPNRVSADIFLNEFSSYGSDDWVELYNDSNESINMKGYTLTDGSTSGNQKEVECIFAPKSYYVFEWGNKLNNKGDVIFLKKDSQIVDCVVYGDFSSEDCSIKIGDIGEGDYAARIADGIGEWAITVKHTNNSANDGSQSPTGGCNIPTNTPTATPSLPLTPQTTFIKTPTPTKTTTRVLSDSDTDYSVQESLESKTTSPTAKKEKETFSVTSDKLDTSSQQTSDKKKLKEASDNNKISPAAYLFILGGFSFLGSGGYLFWQKRQKDDQKQKNA